MDINRVELKGRISSDLSLRKTKNGDDWYSFTVVTNDYNPKAKIEKDKSVATWIPTTVFNPTLVNKIKAIGAHQGTPVWLVGKLFVKTVEKNGVTIPYTSIVVNELEILNTKKKTKEEIPEPNNATINNESAF